MEPMLLEKSELLALLDLMGINEVIGLETEHLPRPEPFERPIILDDGRSRLLEQERLRVAGDHYEIERDLEAMLAIVGDPEHVVRIRRFTPESDDVFWWWYFTSGKGLILLAASGPGEFELDRLGDLDGVIGQISEMLPLKPVPAAIRYRATVDQEDADLIATLVDNLDEVPALTILEADGLAPSEATEFYDDYSEPEWVGRIDFLKRSSGQGVVTLRLLVLQGQELSWLAWQDDPGKSDINLLTATPGAFEEHLHLHLTGMMAKY